MYLQYLTHSCILGRAAAPALIRLTVDERGALEQWTRHGKKERRLVERAKVILLADEGHTNQEIADALKTRQRIKKWCQHFGPVVSLV